MLERFDALGVAGGMIERLDAARRLREAADDLELAQVKAARKAGATWAEIGRCYGLTKQGPSNGLAPSTAGKRPWPLARLPLRAPGGPRPSRVTTVGAVCRAPDHQRALVVTGTTSHATAADHGEKVTDSRGAKLSQVHVDRCQGGIGLLGEDQPVVVPGDGDVVRDLAARGEDRLEHGGGDLVRPADDGVKLRVILEDLYAPPDVPSAATMARTGRGLREPGRAHGGRGQLRGPAAGPPVSNPGR